MGQKFEAIARSPRQSGLGQGGIPKERVAGLFDGIVAITATLLILDIGVPEGGNLTPADLFATTPTVLHWAVSFVMVAVIWTEFHFVLSHSRRWDGGLLAATFAQMALISLIPFAARIVGDFPGSFLAILVFAAIMAANGLLVSENIYVLQQKLRLHVADQSHVLLGRRRRAQTLIYPLSIAISLVAAWLHHPILGVVAWAVCPLALAVHLRRANREDFSANLTEKAAA